MREREGRGREGKGDGREVAITVEFPSPLTGAG